MVEFIGALLCVNKEAFLDSVYTLTMALFDAGLPLRVRKTGRSLARRSGMAGVLPKN